MIYMETQNFFVEVKDLVEEYVDDRILLFKLQATEKAAKASSNAFLLIAAGSLCFILLMIVSFIAGYYLSQKTGSFIIGFGILAGIYFLLIILLIFVHKKYTGKIIADKVVQFSFENKEDQQS